MDRTAVNIRDRIAEILQSSDPDVIIRVVTELIDSAPSCKEEVEAILAEFFISDSRRFRFNAALGLYAITQVKAWILPEASISKKAFERLLAAALVEGDITVKCEMLWALGSQSFKGTLSCYGEIFSKIIEAALLGKFPLLKETCERLVYVYEKIRRQCPNLDLKLELKPQERDWPKEDYSFFEIGSLPQP